MLHKPWGLRRIAADLEESQTPLLFLLLKNYLIIQHFLKWASYTKADIYLLYICNGWVFIGVYIYGITHISLHSMLQIRQELKKALIKERCYNIS